VTLTRAPPPVTDEDPDTLAHEQGYAGRVNGVETACENLSLQFLLRVEQDLQRTVYHISDVELASAFVSS
jgi:hypothetical protein